MFLLRAASITRVGSGMVNRTGTIFPLASCSGIFGRPTGRGLGLDSGTLNLLHIGSLDGGLWRRYRPPCAGL